LVGDAVFRADLVAATEHEPPLAYVNVSADDTRAQDGVEARGLSTLTR
jgi:hypothetical protein